MLGTRARRTAGWIAIGALAVSACSVSEPRNQSAVGATGEPADATLEIVGADGDMAALSGDAGATAAAGGGAVGAELSGQGNGTSGVTVTAGSIGGSAAGGATGGAAASAPAGGTEAAGSASGATATTVAGAPRTSSAPGVTSDKIVVSVIAGFSGPLAPVVEQSYAGLQTWLDDVNASGGIHGRKLEIKRVDHKETADGGIAACKTALSNGSFVSMVPEGVEANVTAISCLDAAGVPTLYFSGTIDPKWKVAFSDFVSSAQAGVALASYVRQRLGGTTKKVGILYVNQLAYKAVSDTFVPKARSLGVNVAAVEAVEPNQASFVSQLLKMQQDDVEIVVISATAEAIGILRDAKSIGFTPTFTGWGFLFDFVTVAGRDLFRDVSGMRGNATVDSAAYQRYSARMEARGRGRDRTVDTEGFLAYAHGLLLGEMLKRAGPNPTRASFVAGAETIQNYDNGILAPITYGPGDHVGTEAVFPSVCCSGDWTWKGQGAARASF